MLGVRCSLFILASCRLHVSNVQREESKQSLFEFHCSWGIQRAQKPTFPLPKTSHPEIAMTACLNTQLLCHFSVLCPVTFCLPYSEEVTVGESENSGLLKPALSNLRTELTSLLSPCYLLLRWWPATSSCVLVGSDPHQWLGRHPSSWSTATHSSGRRRSFDSSAAVARKNYYLLQPTTHRPREDVSAIRHLRQRNEFQNNVNFLMSKSLPFFQEYLLRNRGRRDTFTLTDSAGRRIKRIKINNEYAL